MKINVKRCQTSQYVVFTILLLLPLLVQAQYMEGPTEVTAEEEYNYHFRDLIGYEGQTATWTAGNFFDITYGQGEKVTGLGASATYRFNYPDMYFVEVSLSDGPSGSMVVYALPRQPSIVSIEPAVLCETGTVRITAVYPSANIYGQNFRWYTSSTGGSPIATGATLEQFISSTTTYYVSTTAPSGESRNRTPVTVTVTTNTVAMPSVTMAYGIVGADVTVRASGADNGVRYTWQSNLGGGPRTTTEDHTSYLAPPESTFTFVSVRLDNGVCQGPIAWIPITVYPKPVLTGSGLAMGEDATLVCSAGYDSYTWYLNGNPVYTSSQNTYSTDIPGVYKVVVTKNGASGESNTVTVGTGQFDNQDENYIITNAVQQKEVSTFEAVASLNRKGNMQTTQYYDGIGRPMQSVSTQGSPLGYDIIQPVVYDSYGRETKKYLPVVTKTHDGWYKPDVIDNTGNYAGWAATNAYNNGAGDKIDDSSQPYAETVFETSPLNRVLKQGAPGVPWQPVAGSTYADPADDHSIKKAYVYNGPAEVILLDYNETTKRIGLAATIYYVENRLYVNKTKDEHNNEVIEYVDKDGHTILKKVETKEGSQTVYAETYYIYDDFGNLMVVLPPEAMKRVRTIFNIQP